MTMYDVDDRCGFYFIHDSVYNKKAAFKCPRFNRAGARVRAARWSEIAQSEMRTCGLDVRAATAHAPEGDGRW